GWRAPQIPADRGVDAAVSRLSPPINGTRFAWSLLAHVPRSSSTTSRCLRLTIPRLPKRVWLASGPRPTASRHSMPLSMGTRNSSLADQAAGDPRSSTGVLHCPYIEKRLRFFTHERLCRNRVRKLAFAPRLPNGTESGATLVCRGSRRLAGAHWRHRCRFHTHRRCLQAAVRRTLRR